jgi:ferredoxin
VEELETPFPSGDQAMADIDKVKITILADECIGDSACQDDAPNTFKLNDDGIAVVLEDSTDDLDTILNAANNCPTEAIIVEDRETGEKLAPS